jgi:4-amino-4-deoxy-L-arabinose transferase-like glycosyltransferase
MSVNLPETDRRRMSEAFILILITLLSGGIFYSLAIYFSYRKPLMIGDSDQYARMADNLINHQVLSLENHAEGKPFYPTIARMPGYPVLLGILKLAFGDSGWNIPILNLTAYLMSCLIISRFALGLFGFIPAAMTAIFTTSHFSSIYYAMTGLSESTTNFIIIGLFFIYQMYKESESMRTLAFIGMITGIAGLYREPVLPILVIGFITIGIEWNSSFRTNSKRLALFLACMLAAYSPWIYRNYNLSNQFIPVTIFGKVSNSPIRIWQDNGDITLLLTSKDWDKVIEVEEALFSIINQKTGYPYAILYGNPENQQPVTNPALIPDLKKYFPYETFDLIASDPKMAPTIKCEILFYKFIGNATKSQIKHVSLSRRLKTNFVRLCHLYSCNDMSQHSSIKPYYTHKLMQFRWYCIEFPLAIIGMAYGLTNKKTLPFLAFILLYTILIVSKMHIEPRYAYLPILFIKMFIGYGLYILAKSMKTKSARFRANSQVSTLIGRQ